MSGVPRREIMMATECGYELMLECDANIQEALLPLNVLTAESAGFED
jgi:hypothetical protein